MDLERDVVRKRNIVLAVLAGTVLMLGLVFWTLRPTPRPEMTASVAPAPAAEPEAPTGRTNITSAQEPVRPVQPAPRPASPPPAPAQPQKAEHPTPPPAPAPIDPTKVGPGQLNLPGSGPFTPAPYVPPPPGWEPPPGWTFVPPQVLNLDAGAPQPAPSP